MDQILKSKHAVIYGAAGGIGTAVARTFARTGQRAIRRPSSSLRVAAHPPARSLKENENGAAEPKVGRPAENAR
jgi:NAD(P)-dependent dehydrogenase (short-subunit alcohol dehydrogenase family)